MTDSSTHAVPTIDIQMPEVNLHADRHRSGDAGYDDRLFRFHLGAFRTLWDGVRADVRVQGIGTGNDDRGPFLRQRWVGVDGEDRGIVTTETWIDGASPHGRPRFVHRLLFTISGRTLDLTPLLRRDPENAEIDVMIADIQRELDAIADLRYRVTEVIGLQAPHFALAA